MIRTTTVRSILAMLTALVALAAAPAKAGWVSPTGAGPGPARVRTTAPDEVRLRVEVVLPGFVSDEVVTAGARYARLRVPGAPYLLDAGAPEIPFLPVNLALPAVGTPRVTVVDSIWHAVPTLPVVPSRGNVLRDRDPAAAPLTFGAAYAAGGIHPAAAVATGRPYVVRGRRGVGLRVFPVRWDADRGVLLVLERLVLEVTTTGTGGENSRTGPVPPAQAGFAEAWPRRFVNAAPDKYRALPTGGRLLVVCADGFVDPVQPFAQWKRERGLEVEVVAVSDLGGTADAIAAAVAERYFSAAGLGYVVLAGDVPAVPTFAGLYEGADDDTRYALVDGDDLYPDLFVSRVSARDEDELLTQLAKFIRYERDPEPDGDWYPHGAGIASILGEPTDAERADDLRAELLGFTYETVDRLYEPAATGWAIKTALEEGRSLVNYLGHGSGTSWSNPTFNVTDVRDLTNGHRWPLILDVSCANGRFTYDECFAEAWLRAGSPDAPHGAIAMYSASTSTPWVPPTLMQDEAIDLLVAGGTWEIGALCQQGMMKVVDAYPGDIGRQLLEQYNIFGDCSLRLRTARPEPVAVSHAGALAVGVPVFPVDAGVVGATITLTAPGVLHGVAVADADGHAEVRLAAPPTVPGELVLTVTGPNLLTHRETIPVRVPVVVDLDRTELPVGAAGTLNVVLADATGFSGEVMVSLVGHGVPDLQRTVDPPGSASFVVTPAYGENLVIGGRAVDSGWELFRRTVPVSGASPLPAPGLAVRAPDVGMTGSLAPGTAGVVRGWSGGTGLALALTGCGIDTVVAADGDTVVAVVVPRTTGHLAVAVLVPGHRIHEVEIPVIPAVGTVGGDVTNADNGRRVSGARVQIWADGAALVAELQTDPLGEWEFEPDLPAGDYEVVVSAFGYVVDSAFHTLRHGENGWDTTLRASPRMSVAGVVTDAGTSAPLTAVLDIHRRDTGSLVGTARTGVDGTYVTSPLPEGMYDGVLTCTGYVPRTLAFAVSTGGGERSDGMVPLAGRVLIIADNLPLGVPHDYPTKLGKHGRILHYGYTVVPSQSGLTAIQDLLGLGYDAVYLPWSAAAGTDWSTYDAVMVACGDNPEPLSAGLAEAVVDYVRAGGRLLLEGGEVAGARAEDADFQREVLHVVRWREDAAAVADLDLADHALVDGPARVYVGPSFVPVGYATGDQVTAAADARAAACWPGEGCAIVTYDPDPDPVGGQIVFVALDLSRLDQEPRRRLLQNAVEYLLQRPLADATLTGRVDIAGLPADTPVELLLDPGRRRTTAAQDGSLIVPGLVPGAYTALVSATGRTTVARTVQLPPGGTADLGVVELAPTLRSELCDSISTVVPDGDPIGLARILETDATGAVSAVRIQLDVDHPFAADLVVDLTGPDGTTVRLRHGGATAPPATGTYGPDLVPSLGTFVGREAAGTWLLRVTDTADADEGTLQAWCLEIEHAAADDGGPPSVLRALGNHPNPFNPATTISFAVPAPGPVELDVHDLRGRRVKRLRHLAVAAGRQSVLFRGRDEEGRPLASGAYVVRITAGDQRVTAKMLLLR